MGSIFGNFMNIISSDVDKGKGKGQYDDPEKGHDGRYGEKSVSGNSVSVNSLTNPSVSGNAAVSNLGGHPLINGLPAASCSVDVIEGGTNGGNGSYVNGDTGERTELGNNGPQIGQTIPVIGGNDKPNKINGSTLPSGYTLVNSGAVRKIETPDGESYSKADITRNANDYVFNKYFDDLDMSISTMRTITTSTGALNMNISSTALSAMEKTIPGITEAYTSARDDLNDLSRYLDNVMTSGNNRLSSNDTLNAMSVLMQTCDFAASRDDISSDISKNNSVRDISSPSSFLRDFSEKNALMSDDFMRRDSFLDKNFNKDLINDLDRGINPPTIKEYLEEHDGPVIDM